MLCFSINYCFVIFFANGLEVIDMKRDEYLVYKASSYFGSSFSASNLLVFGLFTDVLRAVYLPTSYFGECFTSSTAAFLYKLLLDL